jgi:glycosyltransferase involved in cell wall biosynthesis
LRILIVSQYFWPENFRVNELALELSNRGHQITVLTGVPNYPSGTVFSAYEQDPSAFLHYREVSIVRVPVVPRGQSRLKLLLNYLSFIISGAVIGSWKLRGVKIDVIFVFLVSPITASLPALLIGRFKKAPVTVWILDLWPDTLAAVGVVRSKFILRCVGRLVSFIYKHSERIFVQSRGFFSNIVEHGGDPEKVRYFPGWAEQVFDAPVGPAAHEFGSNGDKFKILFAGNVGEAQDFPSILTAIELLRDQTKIHWTIVGDGRAKVYVSEQVERRKLNDAVTLVGRLPIESMPSLFRAADALLVSLKPDPIFGMTIPGKVQSYLAAGVPILAMLDGEGARVIREAGAGFVSTPGDGRALASEVMRLFNTSAFERAAMGASAQAYAAREFNRSRLIAKLEQELAELLHHRAGM